MTHQHRDWPYDNAPTRDDRYEQVYRAPEVIGDAEIDWAYIWIWVGIITGAAIWTVLLAFGLGWLWRLVA